MEYILPLPLVYNNPFQLRQFNYEGIIGRDNNFYRFAACRYGLRAAALTIVRLYFKKNKLTLNDILICIPCIRSLSNYRYNDCIDYLSKRLHVDRYEDIMLGVSDGQLGFLRALVLNILAFLYGHKVVCFWYDFESADYAISSAKLEMIYKYHV